MKDMYFQKLGEALDYYGVSNKEEIIDKYKKRYEFGLEASMTEEEIEEKLGDPYDIAREYMDDDIPSIKIGYNLIVKTVADNIIIKKTSDNKIHTIFDDIDMNCYKVENSAKTGVLIDFYKKKYFSLNRRKGTITIEVPEDRIFDKVEIVTASGEINIDAVKGNKIDAGVVSGDVSFNYLVGNEITLHTVSGDIEGYSIKAKESTLNSVSGDYKINIATAEIIRIDTVSGDIHIENSTGNVRSSSVTGDVVVGGIINKNMKDKIKGVFKGWV